jgi:hypothetical protein
MATPDKDTSESSSTQGDSHQEESKSRKTVEHWNMPLFSQEGKKWYSPKFWGLLIVDIALLIKWFFWHRYQSVKADRWVVNHDVTYAIQEVQLMQRDNELTKTEERSLERIESSLENIANELNIKSNRLEHLSEESISEEDQ